MPASMDLSRLTRKTSPKPTLLLCHGWPDTAALFAGLINNHLLPHGYGIIAPDCLGYGGTSKPTSPKEYAFDLMTADISEILSAEGIPQVVSLGHDWGSALAQRFYNFYPSKCVGLVLLNVAYIPPTGEPFDLNATNTATAAVFDGHGIYEYWHLFTAEDGSAIENANLESVYTVAFADPNTWLENWCSPGGMRRYLTDGRTQPTLPFAGGEHKRDFMERFGKKDSNGEGGGFEAPNCWYKAYAFNIQSEVEKRIAGNGAVEVNVPFYFWGGEQDFVCRPVALQASVGAGLFKKGWKSQTRQGGHWALLEREGEFGGDLVGWLEETYGGGKGEL